MRRHRYGWIFVLAGMLAVGPALAQSSQDLPAKPIGRVVIVSGTATVERTGALVVLTSVDKADLLKKGDRVYLGDVVTTGDYSQLGINFIDTSASYGRYSSKTT